MDIDLQHAHAFDVSMAEALAIQQDLARKVIRDNRIGVPSLIAGIEVMHVRARGVVAAACVILRWPGLERVGKAVADRVARFPPVRDMSAFAELPVVLHVLGQAGSRPDLILMGTPGIAHGRGLGPASHLGVLLGIVQTVMQIQEGTVTMIPKLLLMGIALLILLPWMTEQLVEYSRDVILNIPNIVSRGSP